MPGPGPLAEGDPREIDDYRLIGVLGEGGQGVVYLGRAPSGRQVAVKVLHGRMAADPKVRERFLREAEVIRRVAAFCTAKVLDTGIVGDRPYMVSEYIQGPSLQDLVAAEGPRAGGALDRIAVTTLTALAAIHRAGIIHRDFKPRNVIMGPEGPVVIDFGIASVPDHTATHSSVMGTPAYLAPEQLNGEEAGPASDVFGWAATMVYAATGHPAFPGDVSAVVMNAVLNRKPDLAGVPDRLRPLLAAALVKRPEDRPAVTDLLDALTRDEVSRAPGTPRGRGVRPRVRKAVVAVAVAAGLVLGAVWLQEPSPAGPGPAAGGTGGPASFGMPVGRPFTGTADVLTVAAAELAGRPVVLSGGKDRMVRVWDLATGRAVGRPLAGHTDWVWSVAAAELDGRPVAVSGGRDGTVRVWDLATGRPVGRPFTSGAAVLTVAAAELDGRPVVLSGGDDETVRVWDLATGRPVGEPFTGHGEPVFSVVAAELAGRPVVVSGGEDRTVRVWDLATGRAVGEPYAGHTDFVIEVDVAELAGRPVVISGGEDETIQVWDLATRKQVTGPIFGHGRAVHSVEAATLDGRPVLVSGSEDETVRVWDLATGKPIGGPFTGHTDWVWSVGVARLDGRPVALSGGEDETIRVWSLGPPAP
ncbi:hypothetical protein Misp01_53750 [Microtetraspora sp. NBRC 13810]|uniref:WD40 repeat domain-containing serine/threonine protein kinase n=1 Tax=Microtetraspora sp. NBRC 13810 TaxID=3030990 RepID=UPI002554699A|nr:serine/threonine-protein kinase [Microtetraspora sp. NBRC 13810]GLW10247.1 hypothetical protein Misp01_53750 [Microtetraspora sp. NBRC 13810]